MQDFGMEMELFDQTLLFVGQQVLLCLNVMHWITRGFRVREDSSIQRFG